MNGTLVATGFAPTAMSLPEFPLPGDFVIRRGERRGVARVTEEWVVCVWPNSEIVVAGPYHSYAYAFLQASSLRSDQPRSIWRDLESTRRRERLELVSSGSGAAAG